MIPEGPSSQIIWSRKGNATFKMRLPIASYMMVTVLEVVLLLKSSRTMSNPFILLLTLTLLRSRLFKHKVYLVAQVVTLFEAINMLSTLWQRIHHSKLATPPCPLRAVVDILSTHKWDCHPMLLIENVWH